MLRSWFVACGLRVESGGCLILRTNGLRLSVPHDLGLWHWSCVLLLFGFCAVILQCILNTYISIQWIHINSISKHTHIGLHAEIECSRSSVIIYNNIYSAIISFFFLLSLVSCRSLSVPDPVLSTPPQMVVTMGWTSRTWRHRWPRCSRCASRWRPISSRYASGWKLGAACMTTLSAAVSGTQTSWKSGKKNGNLG